MNVLLDANISYRLKRSLAKYFEKIEHVENIAKSMTDLQIWEYAKQNSFTLITSDDDFEGILNIKGYPPKIILLKMGNQSNNSIAIRIISLIDTILKF